MNSPTPVTIFPPRRRARAIALIALFGMAFPVAAEKPLRDLPAGRAAYEQSCARCHGGSGHGDGLDAKRFYPRPRDLTLGVYKFRATVSGAPPTDDDLFHTITYGLPGTNMPDWQYLDEATRWQLVYYLESLSPIFGKTQPSPVKTAPDPGARRTDVTRGKALYDKLGCAACHGVKGRANGFSAGTLTDDWTMPIRPANLTEGWSYRGGSDPRAVMLRVLSGIDGAGMPSYAEALSPEEAWQLAHYVRSLQEPAHWKMIVEATRIAGPLPTTLDDPRWAHIEPAHVRVRQAVTPEGEWAHPPTVHAVAVQIVYNDQDVAMRLQWDDPTQSTQAAPDGLALLLRPAGVEGDVVTLQAWPHRGSPSLDAAYWSAATGETTERIVRDVEMIRSARAEGRAGQPLQSVARHEDGRWQVLIQRPRHLNHVAEAAALSSDQLIPIGVMVWDGDNANARAISPWIDVILGHLPIKHETVSHPSKR